MKPQCVVFDIGGVLTYIDKTPLQNLCTAQNISPHVFFDDDFLLLQRGTINAREFFAKKSLVLQTAISSIEDAFAALMAHGAPDILMNLKVPFMLASNINEYHYYRFLSLSQNFPCRPQAVLSYQVGYLKPSEPFFLHLKKKLPIATHEVVFIDDKPENLHMARYVGMQTALCPSPRHLAHLLKKLDLLHEF